MLIGDRYKIESDTLNVTLYEKKLHQGKGRSKPSKKKLGDVSWRLIAYFSNPQNALDYLVQKEVMETGMPDLKTVCYKITEIEGLIRNLKGLPGLVQ